ncbi:MAG TPA: hypothetical protein DEQ37_05160 [Clostridiales bacterium]|nr:hypothetical protein [Clostridiales bacterium]HCV68766.1 hypothetical protein [Clostridiales bacterium]
MFNAPFSISDGHFNLAKDLTGNQADSLAKFRCRRGGVPVQHRLEHGSGQFRFQSASGLDSKGDAGRCGFSERSSDRVSIVPGKRRAVNAVEDVLTMGLPVLQRLPLGNLINLPR